MRILLFSTLYPSSIKPRHGVFVEQRLRKLLSSGQVEARVVAPVPWFPSSNARFGSYADFARIPAREVRHDIEVQHPRYLLLPRVGMSSAPFFIAASAIASIKKLIRQGHDFDLIDAHYYYPDGVAAAMIGHYFNKPVVVTARGTDINLIPQYRLPRRMIRWAAGKVDASITVCQALKDEMVAMGIDAGSITVLRNGVDLQMFRPVEDRTRLRARLAIEGRTLLSVGHHIERKGHHLIIEAMQKLPDTKLLIAGDGEEEARLKALTGKLGLEQRVRFLGAVSQEQLRDFYAAADALVLASSREGWANVLLESMACGTPVVATRVWGTPEVVAVPEAGVLIEQRTADAIAAGVQALFASYPDRKATRQYAEQFSWDFTTRGQLALFRRIIAQHGQEAIS